MADRRLHIEVLLDAKGAVKLARTLDGEIIDLVKTTKRAAGTWRDANGRLRDAKGRFAAVEKSAEQASKKVSSFSKAFKAGLGALAVGKLFQGLRNAARVAVDVAEKTASLAETQSKYNTVFGQSVGVVDSYIQANARLLGLTDQQAQELLSTTGAILQGAGFVEEASAQTSVTVAKLAGDLASFNNRQPEDVFRRIQSALTGERESLKDLGIVISEADVQKRALEQTSKTTAKQLTQQEKATATLALITEKAGRAVGDLERTQDSAANKLKRLGAVVRQLQDDFLSGLAPALDKVLGQFGDGEEGARDLATEIGERLGTAVIDFVTFIRDNKDEIREFGELLGDIASGLNTVLNVFRGAVGGAASIIRPIVALFDDPGKLTEEEGRKLFGDDFFDLSQGEFNLRKLQEMGITFRSSHGGTDGDETTATTTNGDDDGGGSRLGTEAERQRLLIALMQEGAAKELAQIDRLFEERKALIRKKFPQEADELIRMAEEARARAQDKVLGLLDEIDFTDEELIIDESHLEVIDGIKTTVVTSQEEMTAAVEAGVLARTEARQREAEEEKRLADEQAEREKKLAEAKQRSAEAHARAIGQEIAANIERAQSAEEAFNAIRALILREIRARLASAIAAQLTSLGPAALIVGPVVAAGVVKLFDAVIPKFARGVTNFRGGPAIVGEHGPEMVTLGRGANVLTNENTRAVIDFMRSGMGAGSMGGINEARLAKLIAQEIAQMPPPIVDVVDIQRSLRRRGKHDRRIGFKS